MRATGMARLPLTTKPRFERRHRHAEVPQTSTATTYNWEHPTRLDSRTDGPLKPALGVTSIGDEDRLIDGLHLTE